MHNSKGTKMEQAASGKTKKTADNFSQEDCIQQEMARPTSSGLGSFGKIARMPGEREFLERGRRFLRENKLPATIFDSRRTRSSWCLLEVHRLAVHRSVMAPTLTKVQHPIEKSAIPEIWICKLLASGEKVDLGETW